MSIYLKVPQISGDVTDSQHAGYGFVFILSTGGVSVFLCMSRVEFIIALSQHLI